MASEFSHFFFNDTATTEIYTLSLHDALPIWVLVATEVAVATLGIPLTGGSRSALLPYLLGPMFSIGLDRKSTRLNSSHANISYAVFCLKKKKNIITL